MWWQESYSGGRGTLLAKMDIRQAYRNVPIHPTDRPLLGMQWKGAIFVDAALPFGLRSAPLIFSVITDVLQWVMEKMGIEWVPHYIDDFITMGAPGSNECEMNTAMMHAACERLGLPVENQRKMKALPPDYCFLSSRWTQWPWSSGSHQKKLLICRGK